jgi:hypothetical protein
MKEMKTVREILVGNLKRQDELGDHGVYGKLCKKDV